MTVQDYDELADFQPQTQRLVIGMQSAMEKIWSKSRGVTRRSNIKEFNVRIANVLEWKANQLEEEIKKLRACLDKQFEAKWTQREEFEKEKSALKARIRELEAQIPGVNHPNDATSHSEPAQDRSVQVKR